MCDITWYPDGNHWSTYVKVCRVSAYMGGTSGYLGGSKKCIDCKHLGRLPHLICIFLYIKGTPLKKDRQNQGVVNTPPIYV